MPSLILSGLGSDIITQGYSGNAVIPFTPEVHAPNNAECEADWNLPSVVYWPEVTA